MSCHRILVPVDFSDLSGRALQSALAWADEDAEITVLHVHPGPFERMMDEGYTSVLRDHGEHLLEHIENSEQALLGAFCPDAVASPRLRKNLYRLGDVASQICEEASNHDLVVMGASMRGRLKRALWGSVAADVMALCAVPVLIVH